MGEHGWEYRRRRPEGTVLYAAVRDHLATLLAEAGEVGRGLPLSFPHRVRWVLLKDAGLLSDVLTVVLRAVFALQRRRARRQGLRGAQAGAVSFIQFFGSALQVTPHFHSLVPDGAFVPREGGVHFEELAPPTQGEVERLLSC